MKNLLLLMMTILLVNVSVQADAGYEVEMAHGESETKCEFMNGNVVKDTGSNDEAGRPAHGAPSANQ